MTAAKKRTTTTTTQQQRNGKKLNDSIKFDKRYIKNPPRNT